MRKQSLQLQKAWLKISGSVRGLPRPDSDDASDSGVGEEDEEIHNQPHKCTKLFSSCFILVTGYTLLAFVHCFKVVLIHVFNYISK